MKEKLDDLMSADKIEKALVDPKDRDALFKTWYADEATSKSVLARLQRTPADTLANSKIISKFNTFIKKEKELDDLLDPVKIKNGMQNFKKQEALFRTWHVDDATALAVTARLDQNRMPNFPIILKFNDYRTRLHYNVVLAPGMETKMLDESAAALANFDTKPMTKIYQSWYDKGITSTEFTSALNTIKDPNKREKYDRFERMYLWFTEMKVKQEAAAAAKKAAEAMD
ncbi:RxLR effector protein [Phytophthora megakarya]|uniref:RxLR effector protein n=1 Tax=Phytophthora megakarya TaxID=4795 RepID=A0A225X2W7_9STRA|nr:RxLR effector protein [Phytophthora megakarya]